MQLDETCIEPSLLGRVADYDAQSFSKGWLTYRCSSLQVSVSPKTHQPMRQPSA